MVVSRAAADPSALCELALPLLRPGGRLLALVGDADHAAKSCSGAAAASGGGTASALAPGILSVEKVSPTPPDLPRRSGVPRRRPLA